MHDIWHQVTYRIFVPTSKYQKFLDQEMKYSPASLISPTPIAPDPAIHAVYSNANVFLWDLLYFSYAQ